MKQYTIFLIYAVGTDVFDFWTNMPYDDAYDEVNKVYSIFIKQYRGKDNLYVSVRQFLQSDMPDHIKI